MKLRVKNLKDEDAKVYVIDDPLVDIEITAHKNSCFFCENCTDIFYDYTNGAYAFCCEYEKDTCKGVRGRCESFVEWQEEIPTEAV